MPGRGACKLPDVLPDLKSFATALAWLVCLACAQAQPNVVVNELVAANTAGLKDADGDQSDWVELYNASAASVNLGGWTLTDDAANPVQWRFPATNLAAHSYLVVFASGKDRAVAGVELHTNFRLENSGGFVGLFRPDLSLASAYNYPAQKDNVAFGSSSLTTSNLLVGATAPVTFRVPVDDALGLTWTGSEEPFDDSAAAGWRAGPASVGYDTNTSNGGVLLETIGEPAISRPNYDTASGSIFVLTAGFSQIGDLTEWSLFSTVTRTLTPVVLRLEGTGAYTITGIGSPRTSTGGGAQSHSFGLVSGSARVGPGFFFGWKDGSNGGNNFGVAPFDSSSTAGVRWFQQHTSFGLNENLGPGQFFGRAYSLRATVRGTLSALIKTNVQQLLFDVNPSLYLRAPFALGAGQTFDTLRLRIHYEDGFVAWLNGVEVARRNAPAPLAHNSISVTDRGVAAAAVAEEIDLSGFSGLLREGGNVLALQGLNEQVAGGEFVLAPELFATKTTVGLQGFIRAPTPGAPNGPGVPGWVADMKFSADRGFYWAPVQVTITSATPGAIIRFTTDGSWPSETSGTVYSAPIPVTNTTILRAAAFYPGYLASDTDTHTYLFPARVGAQPANPSGFPTQWSGVAADYEVDPNVTGTTLPGYALTNVLLALPTVSVVAERGDLFDSTRGIYVNSASTGPTWRRVASVEMMFPDGTPGFAAQASLRMAGDYSSGHGATPKHSMRLAFRNALGQGKLHFPLFPDSDVDDFDQLELRACSTDSWSIEEGYLDNGVLRWTATRATYLRDQFMRDGLRDLGQPTSHGRYVHLYLNGLYWGLYNLVEWMNDAWNEEYFGGDKSEYDVIKDYAELEEGNVTAWNEMLALVNAGFPTEAAYQRLQGNHPDGTRNPAYPIYLNVTNFIDYMLLHIYSGAEDWPGHNWWASRRRGPLSEGFRFYSWDQEISNDSLVRTQVISAFGSTRFEAVNSPSSPAIIYDRLRRNLSFQQRVVDRVQEVMFRDGPLTPLACSNRWLARQSEIDRAIVGESARWGDRRREPPFKRDTNWLGEMAWQANFWASNHTRALQRFRSVGLASSLGAPLFSQYGGAVPAGYSLAMGNPNDSGTIYFTTDGSDPRLVGGDVAAAAQTYLAPLSVNSQTLVRARVRSGTNWSGIVSANYFPPQDLTSLRITEIMYHPLAAGLVDGDEFEFLELMNTGSHPLNLSGLTFSSGITFAFTNGTVLAPGAFFVLARNAVQFASRYPGVPVHGIFSGRLDNAGERLVLSYPGGASVFSVTYGERAPWPIMPDGFGFSLVPVDARSGLDQDAARFWRASTAPGGSPGAGDPEPPARSVRINEVRTHPQGLEGDAIELFNPADVPAQIGGWFLTDDPTAPGKFRIPNDTQIGARSYLLFTENQFNDGNVGPGGNQSFSLSSLGDEVYLCSADANTNLTGYSHGFAYGAAPAGATFGRHVISTGEEQFPAQSVPTLGSANAGPRVGPVVLTEIMFHPDAGGVEFVELQNITSAEVALFDPLHRTNTWRLSGLGFDFPMDLVLAPGQFALVVATNPALFAAQYNVPAGTLVLGPYDGALQNSGERLELQQPDLPGTNGVPYVTVDEVRYNDKAPWPIAADGSGPSLQKRAPASYGNDPVSWIAAAPTPGRALAAGSPPTITASPASLTRKVFDTAAFEVSAAGTAPLSFQWRFNGGNVEGATNAWLILTNVQTIHAGAYSVVVYNPVGVVESLAAILTVLPLPTLASHPQSLSLRGSTNAADYGGTTNRSATFTVNAFSSSPLSFRWRFNGQPIVENPSALTPYLTVTNVTLAADGLYDVVVTDAIGSQTSDPARLTVLLTPQIVVPPAEQRVVQGGSFVASVGIRGNPPPFTYLWRRGSSNLQPPETSSRTNSFFSRTNVQPAQAGPYTVIVTNAAAPTLVVSATYNVIVLADADGDGLPDEWESLYFASPTGANRGADADEDGLTNGAEYQAGTDPVNPLSYLKIEAITASGGVTVTFGALSNRTYLVQFTDALGAGAWSKLADVLARPSDRTEQIHDPGFTTNRFYRLATPAKP